MCMYLCGKQKFRCLVIFGVILLSPLKSDKEYSRHHSQMSVILEEDNFFIQGTIDFSDTVRCVLSSSEGETLTVGFEV